MHTRSSFSPPFPSRPSFSLLAVFTLAVLFAPILSFAQDEPKPAAGAAPAAASTYRAGGVDLQIPPPAADLVEAGVDNRVALEVLAPEQNRLIAAFVTTDDAPRLRTGASDLLNKYALVEVPRSAEFADVTPDKFKEVTAAMDKQFGEILDSSVKEGEDQTNRRLKELNLDDAKVTLDKPAQLGPFFSKPDAYCVGLVIPVTSKGVTVKMVAGVVLLRVRSRMLFVYLYSAYKDEDTVKWVRKTSSDWADAILAANKK